MFTSLLKRIDSSRVHYPNNGAKIYISEFVYGSIDGTITSFTVAAAAAGAGLGIDVVIILGAGSLVADGLSMAVSSLMSKRTEHDLAQNDRRNGHEIPVSYSLTKKPAVTGLVTFASFVVVGSLPLWAYISTLFFNIVEQRYLFVVSTISTALALSIIGALKSWFTDMSITRGVFETLLLGGIAATAAYYIGFFLEKVAGVN